MKVEPSKARVTLKTVAERAGVSVATVSLILSGREEWLEQFRPDTVTKVQQIAKRLGYRVNLFATGLPSGESSFFTLVLADMAMQELGTWQHWAFEGSLLAGVVRAAVQRRLYPVVTTAHHDSDIKQVARVIDGGGFGSIARTTNPALEKLLRHRLKRGHPVVMVFPKRLSAWPTNALDVDNLAIGGIAADLLTRRGRKRWVLVRYQKTSEPHHLRCEGFLQAARQAGVSVRTVCLPMEVDELRIENLEAAPLRQLKPDGVFALDSVCSVGILLAGLEGGLRWGEDTDLVGCDSSLWQSANLPKITSVDISWRKVGMLAFQKLMELTDSRQSRFDTALLNPRVTEGATCPVPATMKSDGPEKGSPISPRLVKRKNSRGDFSFLGSIA